MKTAIALLTKDRIELTRQSIEPLLAGARANLFDLFVIDGSASEENQRALSEIASPVAGILSNITGGADRAIVFALTHLLHHPQKYDCVGLVENDVLLHPDWFGPTSALFKRGKSEGLSVGAVSARSYEDRVLIQRDGYAVMHNLGAGMMLLSRRAANVILNSYRSTWSTDNRRIFSILSGMDIGRYWAFRGSERWLTADWGFDAALARAGLASLALTPSLATMIGQTPSLEEQGLKLVEQPVELLRDHRRFDIYRARLAALRRHEFAHGGKWFVQQDGQHIIFPHQIGTIGGDVGQHWECKWSQGFGPFAYRATEPGAELSFMLFGGGDVMLGGNGQGGRALIQIEEPFYDASPTLAPADSGQILGVQIPPACAYRPVTVNAEEAGVTFYGVRTSDTQPVYPRSFDFFDLPGSVP